MKIFSILYDEFKLIIKDIWLKQLPKVEKFRAFYGVVMNIITIYKIVIDLINFLKLIYKIGHFIYRFEKWQYNSFNQFNN